MKTVFQIMLTKVLKSCETALKQKKELAAGSYNFSTLEVCSQNLKYYNINKQALFSLNLVGILSCLILSSKSRGEFVLIH